MKRLLIAFAVVGLNAAVCAGSLPGETCDVLVVGGGAAGIGAAGEAGRAGARVILVEQGFQVGGNMTSGGVDFPGLFFAYGEQVISGFGWEIVSNAMVLAGTKFPDVSQWRTVRHSRLQHKISIPIFVALAEEALDKAGVKIEYFSAAAGLERVGQTWKAKIHAGSDVRFVTAKVVIDCTGAGSVAAMAGAKLMRSPERSPGTFRYVAKGVPPRSKWNVPAMQKAYREAIADGSLKVGDTRDAIFGFKLFAALLTNYVPDADWSNADRRTATDREGRARMLRLYRFLRRQPGFESFEIVSCAAETGVRETARVEGDYVLTVDDYVSGRTFDDSVCHAFYPVDLHSTDAGVDPKYLKDGVKPTVPYRSLLPKGVDGMLVAGRCLSADRMAMAAIRVQASCMATGQAAGEAAALAVARGVDLRRIDMGELKARLKSRGCIVP